MGGGHHHTQGFQHYVFTKYYLNTIKDESPFLAKTQVHYYLKCTILWEGGAIFPNGTNGREVSSQHHIHQNSHRPDVSTLHHHYGTPESPIWEATRKPKSDLSYFAQNLAKWKMEAGCWESVALGGFKRGAALFSHLMPK